MRQELINLDSTSYEHPMDKEALESVRKMSLLTDATNFIMNYTSIKWQLIQLAGSSFHVTKESCYPLYSLIKESADVLDIDRLPETYTEWSYLINAYTTGYKDMTMLVLNTGTVDLLTEDELRFVIGHELGHVKSGHVIYHQMIWYMSALINKFPIAKQTFMYELMWWYRQSEYTADRAGLLACQNIDAALSAITKMAGIPQKYFSSINKGMILKQAEDFEKSNPGMVDSIMKKLSVLDNTHPWTVKRAAELIRWVDSGDYERVLSEYAGKQCPNGHLCKKDAKKCPICGYKFE